MKLKKVLSMAIAAAMAVSSLMQQPIAMAEGMDFGMTTNNADGSRTLNFGQDSITLKSGGSMITDSVNGGVLRPDNLKTDENKIAVLTLPEIDLKGSGYNKADLLVACKNNASVSFRVGGTEVAKLDNVNNGTWDSYEIKTAELITTQAQGNLTLYITSEDAKTYCGNYVSVRFYNSGAPQVSASPAVPTATAPAATPDPDTDTPVYLNTSYSFEERAADLVSKMTLEEKVSQLGHRAAEIPRLGVKAYDYWKEALHGIARQGKATSFPSPLSMSNTWNRSLIYRIADITSTEARAKNNRYNLSYWSPTVNMARDPRWGRNEETMGEDPYLTGQLGAEFVKGMQGNDKTYLKTISTLKHFAANNNETNRRGGSSVMTEENLRNYYTKVFQNITEEVMPASVMSSYNATTIYRNGELIYHYKPSAANSYLLTNLLRRNWGFDGYVTSDCGAGEDLVKNAAYKKGMLGKSDIPAELGVAEAFLSGLDLECSLSGGNMATTYGVAAVKNGYMSEEYLETVLYHLFLQRFRTGEFDEQSAYRDIKSDVVESESHVAVAQTAAEESWVLLKNEDNILPLKNVKKVAVVGNMADTLALGDYSGSPTKTTTPYEGIVQEMKKQNPDTQVNHLGAVSEDEPLFNVKSMTLVLKNGKTRAVDLSKAVNVTGMTLSGGTLKDVTPNTAAVIKQTDFSDVVSVRVEMATGNRMGGSINIAYGSGGPTVASVSTQHTDDIDTYTVCEGEYTGEDGGYDGTVDMYISATPAVKPFSVAAYKAELDAADVIIAYAGTVPKQDGFGDADASESHDRSSINLPASQSHVEEITAVYPQKTVVAMQTVGQINVEPFMNQCRAILWTSYNGQAQGTALGRVLTGEVNPSGRLSATWYKNADVNKMELANRTKKTIDGIEGYYTDYNIQADGTNPGHTYQYYVGTPVYPFGYGLSYTNYEYSNLQLDKTQIDANGSIHATVDVKNTGDTPGKEVVQLYIAHPQTNASMPEKQLKGFEKIELAPGETKTVEFDLKIKELSLFSETDQKMYVPSGTYTVIATKNAEEEALAKSFSVTGTLSSALKTVKTMPDGLCVNGLIREDGTALEAITKIDSRLSAVMTDEVTADLKDTSAAVTYESSDTAVAVIDTNGIVSSGVKEGIAVITASVTIGGITKTDSYPVVNKLRIRPDLQEIETAKANLKAAYDKMPRAAYSDINFAQIEKIYSDALSSFDAVTTKDDLHTALSKAINAMNSVPMDHLNETYTIESVNPKHIENGVIDYCAGGIPMYSGAAGTVTAENPCGGIQLQARDAAGTVVDSKNLTWQIQKYDDSKRKVAEIDSVTGELTVYGNGIIQVTAADIENLTCARMMVHINMQVEGEYADESNGADLTDAQSGSSGGHDAGSTGDVWMEYKDIKLSNLDSLLIRYAGKNAGVINVSLDKNVSPENLVASGSAAATGGWSSWAESALTLNREVLNTALLNGRLDEYGCATVYIQTNGMNLDYFRLNYIENNDTIPYTIEKVLNKANGKIKVTLGYRGSTLASAVNMLAAVYDQDGTMKSLKRAEVKGSGEYELTTGAQNHDTYRLFIWDSMGGMKPLAEPAEKRYTLPVDSEIVVYSLDSKEYDYEKLTGGTDGIAYTDTVNGLSGYGSWAKKEKKASYTYTDVNEKTYDYSFTNTWQAGTGSEQKRSLYFTPKSPCKVTVFFNGAEGRDMYISQDGKKIATGIGSGQDTAFSAQITDITRPVYVYGGNSNKNLYAIIVEYYGETGEHTDISSGAVPEEEDFDRPVQFAAWGSANAVLTKNDATGESKVWLLGVNGDRIPLSTEYFYQSDIPYQYDDTYAVNQLAEYKGRLYAGCDNGLVIVFTDCMKCYQLRKAAEIDIKQMRIGGGVMYISDGTTDLEVDMSALGGDSIEPDEAKLMLSNGAVLVDVRGAEEFEKDHADGSVNIPVEMLDALSGMYNKDTVIIFCCQAGTKAGIAVERAQQMGFKTVYNGGSYADF